MLPKASLDEAGTARGKLGQYVWLQNSAIAAARFRNMLTRQNWAIRSFLTADDDDDMS